MEKKDYAYIGTILFVSGLIIKLVINLAKILSNLSTIPWNNYIGMGGLKDINTFSSIMIFIGCISLIVIYVPILKPVIATVSRFFAKKNRGNQ